MAHSMEYSSNDISAYFLHCPECDIQWRSHHLQTCEYCSTMGITLLLNEAQIKVLLEAVRMQLFDDNTDILFMLSEMREFWSDVPEAYLAQACWMHLRRREKTEEIKIAMEYFEERFQDSLVEEFTPPHPSPVEMEIAMEYFEERFQDSLVEA